jgi:(p)ppGpp synthase/HD superfamily hydrolase
MGVLKAKPIAILAHDGQVDKGGAPYIGHPYRVADKISALARFSNLNETQLEAAREAAWLHDVIEDAGVTQKELREAGISELAIEVIELLTRDEHNPERSGDTYYRNIKAHPVARVVKIADIADNSNHSRKAQMLANGKSVKPGKYEHALAMLELTADEQEWFDKDIKDLVH